MITYAPGFAGNSPILFWVFVPVGIILLIVAIRTLWATRSWPALAFGLIALAGALVFFMLPYLL